MNTTPKNGTGEPAARIIGGTPRLAAARAIRRLARNTQAGELANRTVRARHWTAPEPARSGALRVAYGAFCRRALLGWGHTCGWLSGHLILQAAKAFMRAGDLHEVRHCCAALDAGNSERCTDLNCQLQTVERTLG